MAEMQSNRNDDVFGSTDKQFGIPNIDSLALKYSKAQLQQMAQMGRIPPIYAVMAGMAQDRVELNNSHAPTTTVAQDTFSPQVAGVAPGNAVPGNGAREAPGGSIQEIKARTHGAEMGWDPRNSAAAISKAHGGLMSIPRPGEKYNQDNFATGGIVAFQQGGMPGDPTDEELAAFQAEAEQARGANTRPMFEQQNYRLNQGPSGGLPQIMDSPQAPVVSSPTSAVAVENQKQLAKVRPAAPAPVGPLTAMAAPPASDEFAQQGMNALKLPKRTPADTTGLVDTPESIAKNKEDLLYRTVGYTGAEMMAGKSPFALVNIGEALSKGFSSYAQQIEAHKKSTKDDIKDLAAVRRGEQALEQGDYKIAMDVYNNQLTNDRALEVAKMQIKKDLDVAKIGAESRKLDKNITPFEVYANPNSTSEQKANALEFAGMGKRNFGPEQGLKLEELWVEERSLPKYRNLSDAQLAVAKQNWIATIPGMEKMGGGGKGIKAGETFGGFTFKGGDPNIKTNWTKA